MATDHELLNAWAAGDEASGRAFYARYADRITRFFARKVSPEEAADLVQRTFLKALGAWRGGAEVGHVSGWLFAIARNQLYDALRTSLRAEFQPMRTSVADLRTAAPSALVAHEAQRHLMAALLSLPLEEQLALELFYWEDLPMAEVGRALGITRSAAINRVHRARGKLREAMARASLPAAPPVGFTTWARSLRPLEPFESSLRSVAACSVFETADQENPTCCAASSPYSVATSPSSSA